MSTRTTHLPLRLVRRLAWGRLRSRSRALIALVVTLFTLLSATVAFAQASSNFDLACRSLMTAGSSTMTGGNFGVTAALGMSIVPPRGPETPPTYAVRSTSYGVRAGFLPGYPNGQSALAASVETPDQSFVQHLPLLYKVVYLIRGGC